MSKSKVGHNSISKEQLKSIVERIERLEEEKAALADDVRDIYTEAKGNGYDVKTIRKCVKLRKQDATQRDEEECQLQLYKQALGLGTAMLE